MARFLFPLWAIWLFSAGMPLAAQEARPSAALCERSALPGRGYIECLEQNVRTSDDALGQEMKRAVASIEARSDLAPTQRTRWKNVLEESQGLFVRLRNFECQNVAPYEGSGGRIGAFEERLACLVDHNVRRTRSLAGRYRNP